MIPSKIFCLLEKNRRWDVFLGNLSHTRANKREQFAGNYFNDTDDNYELLLPNLQIIIIYYTLLRLDC